jgi:predicted nucleic acid-binding protein
VEGTRRFDAFLGQFGEWFEIDCEHRIWRRSLELMAVHQLRSIDAIHVATAQEVGVLDFATSDDHFRRVAGLNLWLMRDPATPT